MSSRSTGDEEAVAEVELDEVKLDVEESPDQTEASSPVAEEPAPQEPVDVNGILRTTQDRVARILATTEKAAADIVDAANAESEQIVHDTHTKASDLAKSKMDQIDSVTDELLKRANAVAEEVEGLRKLIDTSIETLAQELGVGDEAPVPAPSFEPAPGPSLAPVPESEFEPVLSSDDLDADALVEDTNGKGGLLSRMRNNTKRDASEGVKLLAAQMIAAGHTWEEARVRLSDEFGVKDPTIALDAVYRDGGATE